MVFRQPSIRGRIRLRLCWALLVAITLPMVVVSVSHAQVTTAIVSDGSLGTQVNQSGNVYNINEGTIRGANQFHSLGLFSVGEGDIASFNGPTGIENILSRVTGGVRSEIFGTIRSTIDGANLFLMNPVGVMFGPNASLDISGSFHATTADFLRSGEDGIFYASLAEESVLTMAPPETFGFLGKNRGEIIVDQSLLEVPVNKNLSLVGGDINIASGNLTAPDGQINLVSVSSSGTALLQGNDATTDAARLGNINLFDTAVMVSGPKSGSVLIRSGQLVLEEQSVISANITGSSEDPAQGPAISIDVTGDVVLNDRSTLEANVFDGSKNGRDIILNVGKQLEIRGGTTDLSLGPFAANGVRTLALGGSGHASDIEISADSILLVGELMGIQSATLFPSTGDSGEIRVRANSLQINGQVNGEQARVGAIISSFTLGEGRGGDVNINVGEGEIQLNNGQITATTFGANGNGGNLKLEARNLRMTNTAIVQTGNGGPGGNAGSATIELTGNLDIRSGAFIGSLVDSSAASESGGAGDFIVTAQDIVITGIENATDPLSSPDFTGIRTRSGTQSGGDVIINADNLQLTNNGVIRSASLGLEPAGDITIKLSGDLELANRGQILATAEGSGNAGNITVFANNLNLRPEGSSITAQSISTGNAGKIQITATDTILLDGGSITTEAAQASGGNIELESQELIRLNNSTIASSVQGEATTVGGNIRLDPEFIILQNSQILAKAVAGQGGNISLIASKAVLVDPLSVLDASSALGVSGSVNIQAPIQNLSGTIAPLPQDPAPVTALYGTRCVAGAGGHFSTFVDSKVDSLTPRPGTFLASPFLPQVSSSSEGASGHAGAPSGIAGTGHAAPIQLAAYVPPLLFQHGDGMLSACP